MKMEESPMGGEQREDDFITYHFNNELSNDGPPSLMHTQEMV